MNIVEQMLKNAGTPLPHIADVSGSALFQGDCLDIMPLIPDKSVQLILADLPYGTTSCKWDSVIDLESLWKQYNRIVKPNGAIVLNSAEPFTSVLICSNIKDFRYKWVWDKVNRYTGYANANKMPLKRHEDIVVFYKKLPIYNKQMIDGKPYKYIRKKNKEEHLGQNGLTDRIGGSIDGKRNPFDIISITGDNKKESGLHPTQKPLELMKYLISTYSNENDMVLDNTMGSGTTCLASKELNRSFVGIEKEVKYYDLAVARVFG